MRLPFFSRAVQPTQAAAPPAAPPESIEVRRLCAEIEAAHESRKQRSGELPAAATTNDG